MPGPGNGEAPHGAQAVLPELYAGLLETLPAAAYTCDLAGLITYYNPEASRLWGRQPALNDPRDRYCGSFRLFSAEGEPLRHEDCWMALALREDRAFRGREIEIERPDGTRVRALAYANPVHGEGGRPVGAVNVLVDITERAALERKLSGLQNDYADFFEHGPLGLHWVGPDGTILRANQAELDLLGYDRDEYVGHHVSEFHVDQEGVRDILARLAKGETLRDVEARLRCKDGSVKHVSLTSNVLWRDGDFVHTRCFVYDISDRKRAGEALREADERKNEFLAMLAHELRNPLAPIINAVELLRRSGPPDEELAGLRSVIERQAHHMKRLVDDLLDIARITRGKLHIARERVLLSDLVQTTLETARSLLVERDHELTVALPDEPVYLDVDPVRMAQVLSNLLANAAKYTDPGGHIRMEAARVPGTDVNGGTVPSLLLTVADDGVGMEPGDLESVFDMFVQSGSGSRSGLRGGLGVGLTLVRSIVEMHGGSVEARSEGPGRGSTFVVHLPLADAPVAGATVAPPPRCTGRQVLVVDDHPDSAACLARLLESEGHRVEIALDGNQALHLADESHPEVVLLDIGLPDIDGYEACRRIRGTDWGRKALVIAITGWGQASDKERTHAAGFDAHLTKPTDFQELCALLARSRDGRS